MVILVYGLPGSGKTFLAKNLAEKINAVHLNSDRIRKEIGKWDKYTKEAKQDVYGTLLKKMQEMVLTGNNVIIDATFYKEKIRNEFLEASDQLGKPCKLIEVRAGEPTIKKRLSKPRVDSQADFEIYQKIRDEFEEVKEKHLTLFSDEITIEEMIKRALTYLGLQ